LFDCHDLPGGCVFSPPAGISSEEAPVGKMQPLEEPSIKKARPAVYIVRAAAACLRAHAEKSTPINAAHRMFNDPVTDIVLRSATSAADTTSTGWAKELAGVAIYDTIQSITSISAAAALIDRGLKLSMDGVAEMRVPGRVLNAAAAGLWTSEEAPAPARQLTFSNVAILHPRKLSVIVVVSREQAASSNIEAIVRQTLGEAAGLALDAQMFSATAGDTAKPAGLFVGVTGQTPVAGGGINAMEGDIKNLFTALAAAGGGKTAVIVAAVPQAVALQMHVGPQFSVPILASSGMAAGSVAVVESASFVSGFSSTPEFRTSDQAIYHAEDTSPADPIMSGQPVRSLWQTEGIALKMDVFAAYALRAAGHAQFVTSVTW
jgi:hypothetical protein